MSAVALSNDVLPPRHAAPSLLARTATLVATAALGACASVPFDVPKDVSEALPANPETFLGAEAADWRVKHPGTSAFYPLADGRDALGARLRLIELAEQTIDAQYFLLKPDHAGALFTGKLLRAADRGVRVRFLLDDVFTPDLDAELTLLDSHPNIEVRLFNPLSRQGLRAVSYIADFSRANRRMHNKSFTVDNAVTIVGGRNIADEYFRIDDDVDFADYELVAFGPVAPKVSATFDVFWNSPRAVPISAFEREVDPTQLDAWREIIDAEVEGAGSGIYASAINSTLLRDIREGRVEPYIGPVSVVTDRPDKLERPPGEDNTGLAEALAGRMRSARSELFLITPYFVPGEDGVRFLSEIAAKGVRIVVVTNSLASTNHVAVHSGYFYRREALLAAGIEIYEVKVDALTTGDAPREGGAGRLTLHTKAMIFDRETLFVGSINLDPRSIDINTEMGLFVESTEAAEDVALTLDSDLGLYAYRLVLDGGAVQWRYEGGEQPVVLTGEPDAGFWRNFQLGLYQLLPIEDQL